MEPTKDILQQIKAIWGRFGAGARIGIVAATAVVFGGILLATLWAGRPEYRSLDMDIAPGDVPAVVTRLEEEGLDYKILPDGATILVERSHVDRARSALTAGGLVRGKPDESEGGLFGSGATLNRRQLEIENARRTEKRLEEALERFVYIDDAKVTITPARDRIYRSQRQPAKASVQVAARGTLSEHQIQSIAHTVASGVEALSADDVTISDMLGIVLKSPSGADGPGLAGGFLKQQRAIEEAKTAKAQSRLDAVFGPNKVFVTVAAEIDWTRSQVQETRYDPSTGVTRQRQRNEQTSTSERRVPGGAVGSRVPGDGNGAVGEESIVSTTESKDFDTIRTEQSRPGGDIKRLTAAVAVDESLADQMDQIRRDVEGAIGYDAERGDVVTVYATAIQGPTVVDADGAEPAIETATAVAWAQWGLWGLLGAAFLFFSLRTIKRSRDSLREVLERSLVEEETEKKPVEEAPIEAQVLANLKGNTDLAGRSLKRWLHDPVGVE